VSEPSGDTAVNTRAGTPAPSSPARWAAAVLAAALLATFWGIGLFWWGLVLTGLFALAALPGFVLARGLYGATPLVWMVGLVWGTTLTSLVLLVLWVGGLRHPLALVLAPVIALAPALLARRWSGLLSPPRLDRRDLLWLLVVLLLVPAVVGRPYSRVGADVEDGRAYRAYFTADFVWKMAVVTEVAKGDIPPRNQFLDGEPLYYYWLPHLLSGVEYRALQSQVRLDRLLLVNGVLFGLAFLAFLYGFTRHFVGSPAWSAAGVAVAVLCGSFEGLERLLVFWRDGTPLAHLTNINIDAVSRWYYGTLPIDGLQRLLLYQPQHHAAAYAMGFSGILVLWQARAPGHPFVMLFAGACLAAAVLLSAFSALMITTMIIPIAALLLLRAGTTIAELVRGAVLGAIPIALAGGAALLLSYVDRSESLIEIGWHHMALNRLWPGFPMNFGAALPAAAVALGWMALTRNPAALPLGVIVFGSFAYYFLVNVRDVQDVYVGWRAGHLLFMATAPLAGYVLWRAAQLAPWARWTVGGTAALLVLAALPTTVIDLYNTQDITNRRPGPGFRWTIVLTPDEIEALDWVRRETPLRATVQVEPHLRNPETWALIPAFGERRMAAGLPISMVPLTPYHRASNRVLALFASETPEEAFARAVDAGVDYLFLGPVERHTYPDFERVLERAPAMFPLVFRSGGSQVLVYQVGRVVRPRAR
jgi:hypothetical protein